MSTRNPGFVVPVHSLAAWSRLPFFLVAGTFRRAFVWHRGPCRVAIGLFLGFFGGGRGGGVLHLRLTWKCEVGGQLGLKRLIWG